MRKLIVISLLVVLSGCKIWDWGETYHYVIQAGKHSDKNCPMVIHETEVWGGEMILTYNPERMIDTVYNFSYWNKLGGMMPDITSNMIEGKHQSARVAWRINPPDMDHIYLGYIVYVYGKTEPYRDYLLTPEGERIKIAIGQPFHIFVSKKKEWWGITYGHDEAYIKIVDTHLKREKFMVVMDPYYGGIPPAPTGINISLKIKDTTWMY